MYGVCPLTPHPHCQVIMEADALALVGALLLKEELTCLMWQNGSTVNCDTEVPKLLGK